MTDPYAVTNLKIGQSTALSAAGIPQQIVTVSYMVGRDGPFTDKYPAATFTDAMATGGINARISTLRAVRTAFPSS